MAKKKLSVLVEDYKAECRSLRMRLADKDRQHLAELDEVKTALNATLRALALKFGDIEQNDEGTVYRIVMPTPEITEDKVAFSVADEGIQIEMTVLH